jgi:hypothetical protein
LIHAVRTGSPRPARTRVGALAVLVLVVGASGLSLSACRVKESCQKATLSAQPGTVVQFDGDPALELSARFVRADDGKPIKGAEIRFAYNFKRPGEAPHGLIEGEEDTDAAGVARFHKRLRILAVDVKAGGALEPSFEARWEHQSEVGGVNYCSTRSSSTIPVAQLGLPTP